MSESILTVILKRHVAELRSCAEQFPEEASKELREALEELQQVVDKIDEEFNLQL